MFEINEDRGLFEPYTFVVCPCCGEELDQYPNHDKTIKTIE